MISSKTALFQIFLVLWVGKNPFTFSENSTSSKMIIKLGGLFTIYGRGSKETCNHTDLLYESVEKSEMALYAIDQINKNMNILPGIELVLAVKPDCHVDTIALNEIIKVIRHCEIGEMSEDADPDRFWGLIGPLRSEVAVPVAKLLGLFNFPQISCGATASVLSDKQRFPSFFRTVPSDKYQITAIVDLLKYNDWSYVSFIYEDDDYGIAAFDSFQEEIAKKNICLSQQYKLVRNADDSKFKYIVSSMERETSSNVVVVFLFENRLKDLFKEVYVKNLTNRFQWIGSDAWSGLLHSDCLDRSHEYDQDYEIINSVIDGAIVFQLQTNYSADFDNYFYTKTFAQAKATNQYMAHLIAKSSSCSYQDNSPYACNGNLTLRSSDQSGLNGLFSATCSSSVYAFAHALEDARKSLCTGAEICSDFRNLNNTELVGYLRNVSFTNDFGDGFRFSDEQDGPERYDIFRYNKKTSCWKKIGKFSNSNSFSDEVLSRGRGNITSTCSQKCEGTQYKIYYSEQTCCWHCTECGTNEGLNLSYVDSPTSNLSLACFSCDNYSRPLNHSCVRLKESYLSFEVPIAWAVAVISVLGILLTFITGVIYACNWNTPLVRASGRELSTLILFGILLAFAVPFLFCVRPTDFICGARRMSIGFSFTVVFAGLLVKTIRISIVFNHLGKHLVRDYKLILRPGPQIVTALLLTSVEVFILIVWLFYIVPETVIKPPPLHLSFEEASNVVDCKGLDSKNILIGLGYPIILILVCTIFAIKIRKVPAGFNEAKFIGFAVYTTLVIWLAQLSTYFVQMTSQTALRDAIYCLCLSLNILVILLALFGPKVYVIMLRPEKNNQSVVMSTSRHHSISVGAVNSVHTTRKNNDQQEENVKKKAAKRHFPKKRSNEMKRKSFRNRDVDGKTTLPQITLNHTDDVFTQKLTQSSNLSQSSINSSGGDSEITPDPSMRIQRRYTVGDRERKNKNLELKVSSISSLVHRYRGDVNPTYESS